MDEFKITYRNKFILLLHCYLKQHHHEKNNNNISYVIMSGSVRDGFIMILKNSKLYSTVGVHIFKIHRKDFLICRTFMQFV